MDIQTVLNIQTSKKKSTKVDANVVEGFKQKYIKVELEENGIDHVFDLKWNGFMYEGKFMSMVITCDFKVERDFSAVKTKQGVKESGTPVVLHKKRSGYPHR